MKDNIPDWKVQTSEWNVEDSRAWRTEDTDKFFYEIEEKKNDDKIKKAIGKFGVKSNLFLHQKSNNDWGCYGLQVHSNTYNSVMFTGFLCKAC